MFTTNSYLRYDQLLTSVRDPVAQINKQYVLWVATQAAADLVKSAVIRHVFPFHLLIHATPSTKRKMKLLKHCGRHCQGGNS